ncbi:MAG: DHH family phosphoesterase [Oscillospiraceae bacterium]|nr:DHH family phosphoesterase [Oscillospiraceae bacterium]
MQHMNKQYSRLVEPKLRLCFVMLFLFAIASFFFADTAVAVAELVLCVIVYVIFVSASRKRAREISKYIEETMSDISRASKDSSLNFPMPAAVVRIDTNELIWANSEFEDMLGRHDNLFEARLLDIIPGFEINWALEGKHECPVEVTVNDKVYRVYGSVFRSDEAEKGAVLATFYWLDVTGYSKSIEEFESSLQTVSVIIIDNYSEIMNGLSDAERSMIIAEVDKKLAEWTASANGIFIKYERDKYIYIFQQRYLDEYIASKFAILDSVREIESKNGIKITLSIGIGKDGHDFKENHRNARLAIDMALSRGGDQAVIRNKFNFEFFGGRSQELEKRTKVKSRVMANALEGLIRDSSGVVVMGHKNADNDSIGAAVGIACIARKIGKSVSIVTGQKTSADALIKKVRSEHEYDGVFVSAEDALIEADSDTLVVIVDTNRTSVVESEALLESANKIAVIDHHRRGTDYIDGAVLNFHEPYASSTCELVTELLQYIVETRDILSVEAEAILSGIVIDTKKFTMKTGVRTFEAAAYLRRAGADTTELKRILQDDIQTYVKRAELVKLARMYHEKVAIVEYNGSSTRKLAAQAADELLSIRGVQASFVLYREGDGVIISARSLGEINVQIILEKLGGGGHFDTAGAQVSNKKIEEVSQELMSAIDDALS